MQFSYFRLIVAAALGASMLWGQSSTQTTLRNPPAGATHALLVTFGIGDRSEIGWDGSLEVRDGELVELIGYEMGLGDMIHPPRRWEMSTRPAFAFNRRNHDEDILVDLPADTYLTPRFYVYLKGSSATEVSFKTEQGEFAARIADVPQVGSLAFLDGRASVARAPMAMLLGRGHAGRPDERLTDNDFASIEVASDDSIWVAYGGFFRRIRPGLRRPHPAGSGGRARRPPVCGQPGRWRHLSHSRRRRRGRQDLGRVVRTGRWQLGPSRAII